MQNRGYKPRMSRARQRALQRRRLMIGGGALAALVVIGLVILLLPKGGAPDRSLEAAVQVTPVPAEAPAEAQVATEAQALPADTLQPTPVPTPTPQPAPQSTSKRALTRPTPTAEGFMPVFSKADTDEKIIAITVDDCFQADNLKQIVDAAISVGGKLTIFPIGFNAVKKEQAEVLRYAYENGFELENHTYSHNGLFAISADEMAEQVFQQQMALSYVLGVEYQCHFLRPRGGDARRCQRMHMYAKQMGYYGIAHWSVSGSGDDQKIAKGLKPGAIFLFHTTAKDLDKLLRFIPWAAEQGYQLVTLNEMFDYPANETRPLESDPKGRTAPAPEPYEMVYVPLKATSYCWEAYLLQEKLIAMGYLTGEPDGVYGSDCAKAVGKYQQDHGMEATGVADADLVRQILESEA